MQRALKVGRRWLYIVHRWVGVVSALLFVMWFASGLIMLYVPYPSLTPRERLAGAEPIAWNKVHLDPAQALAAAGVTEWPSSFKLEMMLGEPVYRIRDGGRQTISGLDGRPVGQVGPANALEIARDFHTSRAPAKVETITRDQWTVAGGYDDHRPLYKVAFADRSGTTLYVSSTTGEVVLDTTRWERAWNWVGTVPHWIYFTELRKDQPAWRQVILWTSGIGIVGAVSGVWIGILRLRLKRRYAKGKVSPYRGWMKWHHIAGLVAGLTLVTWIVSGWLSVNPNNWFARSSPDPSGLVRYAGAGPRFPLDLGRTHIAPGLNAKEARFAWVAGRPLVILTNSDLRRTLVDANTGEEIQLRTDALFDRAAGLVPGARMVGREVLTHEDLYWYAHHAEPRLPVLRVRFDDPAHTWFHIDPTTGEVLGSMTTSDRVERWAFNFLHDFDLPVLLHTRPTWDVLVWVLSIGGLVISVSSVVIGWRRLKRKGTEIEGWTRRVGKKRPRLVLPAPGE